MERLREAVTTEDTSKEPLPIDDGGRSLPDALDPGTTTGPSVAESSAVEWRMPAPKIGPICTYSAAAMVSLLGHAVLALLIGNATQSLDVGGNGRELEAVGVEVVSPETLESYETTAVPTPGGKAQSIDDRSGTQSPVDQAEMAAAQATSEKPPETRPPPPAADLIEPATTAEAELSASANISKEKPIADDTRLTLETPAPPIQQPQPLTNRKAEPQAEQRALARGGASSRSSVDAAAKPSAAGASAGDLARFAMQVRQSLGRGRPSHSGARGKVVVFFVLSSDGTLVSSHVASSSGKSELDRAALAAVQRAVFPRPPSGMTEEQRSYKVPFEFR